MLILDKIAVFLYLCAVLGITKAKVETVFEKNLDFPGKQLFFVEENLSSNYGQLEGLPYAVCKTIEGDHSTTVQNQTRCTIFVIQSDTLPEKSCNITLQANNKKYSYAIGEYKRVVKLGSEKVMLLWYEWRRTAPPDRDDIERFKCSIVDLTTCQSTAIRLSHFFSHPRWRIHHTSVIPYEDLYDLVMNYGYLNWVTFSLQSNGSHTMDIWNTTTDEYGPNSIAVISVAPDSKSKGHIRFYKQFDLEDDVRPIFSTYKQILLIKSDGSQKQLISGINETTATATSNVHQTVSIAFVTNNETVNVWRFDQEGNLKLNATLHFVYTIDKLQIQNLADGGFLLLTVEFVDMTNHYRVIKFDADGKRIGLLEVPGPKYRCESRSSYYEKVALQEGKLEAGSEGYCLSFVCYPLQYFIFPYDDNEARLNWLVNCFTDKDFSVL